MRPILLALSLALLLPTVARAASPDAISQADLRYKEGRAFFAKWDFENARQSFTQAYALNPEPRILWNLAIAESKANHPVEALAHFKAYFKLPNASAKDREQAKAMIDDAERRTAHVRIDAPDGAQVLVDDVPLVELAPVLDPLDLAPGAHRFEARAGSKAKSAIVSTGAGELLSVSLAFDPEPPPAAPVPTTSASLSIKDTATTPSPKKAPVRAITAIAIGSLGVLAVGTGVGFFVDASSAGHEAAGLRAAHPVCLDPAAPGCIDLRSAADRRARDITAGRFLVVGGVAAAGVGIATWFLWPNESRTFALAPILTPSTVGAQWHATF